MIVPISVSELHDGDEIELTIRTRFLKFDCECLYTSHNLIERHEIFSIHKILPAATPLNVGEILIQENCVSTGWKVLHINKQEKQLNLLNIENDYSFLTKSPNDIKYVPNSVFNKFMRKNGTPIDWDATFKQ